MDIEYVDLWSAWPSCCLCGSQLFSSDNPPYQLNCLHLYCQGCLTGCWNYLDYQCPFCRAGSVQAYFNLDVVNRMDEITYQGYYLSKQAIAAHYYWFRSKINTANVPCRNYFVARSCGARNCCNSHETATWQQVQCPLWDNCARGYFCPYVHSWTQRSVYETVTDVYAYTSASPVTLTQAPETPNLLNVMSTVQAQNYLQKGQVIIRSRSLLNYLLADDNYVLKAAASSYQTHINSINPIQVRYTTSVKWAYYQEDRECYYVEYFSQQLEQAYLRGSLEDVRMGQDVRVNLKLMIQVSQSHYYAVKRVETLISSTVAGTIDIAMQSGYYNQFYETLVKNETGAPLSTYAGYPNLKAVAEKYGLGVVSGQLYGLERDLQQAGMELHATYLQTATPIQCVALHPGIDSASAEALASQMNVAVYDTRVFGRTEDLMHFNYQVQKTFQSLPVPMGVSDGMIKQLCDQYGIRTGNGSLYGTRDKIAMVLGGLTESQIPIPPGTSPQKIAELVGKYGLRQTGNTLCGPREQATAALQELQNQEVTAIYPNRLLAQQVEAVCKKHGVRRDGDKIAGMQAGVLAAINELNAIVPQQAAFRFHQPPAWYTQNREELKLVDLPPTDPEYTAISTQFHQTTPNRITRIRVVQNKRLYTNFAFKHEAYSQIEGRSLEIKRLFHGTRANDPSIIYQSDTGLDSRLGTGMWGNGTYYALNSSYSTGYAHAAADGTKEMFLCEVLVGDYVKLPSDNTLRKPPPKPKSTQCYHSVQGHTGGSDIWITYEPAMSYPHFLINYN